MHPIPLASALLKLARAREHLGALDDEVRRFRESRPYHLVEDVDAQTGEQLAYFVIDRKPDDHLSLTLGDFVDNLRSALDHGIYGLSVAARAPRELTIKEARSVGFPICVDPKDWPKHAGGVRFLPTGMQEFIKSRQPCHVKDGSPSREHPLALLHELWNADKHRTLALVFAWARMELLLVTYDEFNGYWGPPIVDRGSYVFRGARPFSPGEEFHPMIDVHISLQGSRPPGEQPQGARPIGDVANGMFTTVKAILDELGLWRRPFGGPSGFDRHESFFPAPQRPLVP